MRLALVSSGFEHGSGRVGRQVEALARGLARRGVEVEVVAQDASHRSPRISERDGFTVRLFPTSIGRLRFAMAPVLWEYLRRTAGLWDVVHLHASSGALGLGVGGVASRRLVFTPHAPVQRLLRWPYGHVARAVIERAAYTVPLSGVEAGLIRGNVARAADRVRVLPAGVDLAAIRAATPYPYPGTVVLAAGRLERCEHLERTIAAMASLEPRFRLVIVGGGAAARRLDRYAGDLRVAERIQFAGAVSHTDLYRWLRTTRVLVTLSEVEPSAFHLFEALSAGAAVVASDVPVHREAASLAAGVTLVSPQCSPLQLADAIARVSETSVPLRVRDAIPAAESLATKLLPLYHSLTSQGIAARAAAGNGRPQPARPGGADVTEAR